MRTDPTKRDNTRYCEFHRDHGHRTDDCIQLGKEIEYLIRRGYLRRYIASEGQDQALPPPPRQPTPTQHQQPLGEIHVISGGFAGGGESISTRNAHLRSIRSGECGPAFFTCVPTRWRDSLLLLKNHLKKQFGVTTYFFFILKGKK